jgi:hypothetical protein
MTPTRTEIETCARQLWHRDRARSGDPSFDIEPEVNELKEGGFLSVAKSELMTNAERKNEQWINNVSETSDFTVDVQQVFESNALVLGSRHTGKSDLAMMINDKANAIVIVFDPSQDWIARSSIKQYLKVEPYRTLDVPCESTIFDISLLSPTQQQRTVENFSEKLFQSQASNPERTRYLIVFEEAHTYFTQGCMRSENLTNCVRLLSVGRNVSIACVLISQFASMLDKFAIKHSISQMWCGFSREPNDIKYLKQILGSEVEKLSKLNDGEFLYLTRNGLSKIAIEPYESLTQKQKIALPQIKSIEPIKTNQNVSIMPFLKLGMILFFMVLLLLLGVRI